MHVCEFLIDELTECVREVKTGVIVQTEVVPLTWEIAKNIHKKNGWRFDWKAEFKKNENQFFYLKTCSHDDRIQGLIAVKPMLERKLVFMRLIETAPHNYGSKKEYKGVPGNLVAYTCKMSFDLGMEGYVYFIAKTKMINHYEVELGAEVISRRENTMMIRTVNALKLVNLYFKN